MGWEFLSEIVAINNLKIWRCFSLPQLYLAAVLIAASEPFNFVDLASCQQVLISWSFVVESQDIQKDTQEFFECSLTVYESIQKYIDF